jgi:ribosome-binding protein aMBF1 (putative translation factor)
MKPKQTATRVTRALTPSEKRTLDRARAETETSREKILSEARVAKLAWAAMRLDIDQTVASLRSERERLGLSLVDVEARCGLKRSAISRLENDKTHNPSFLTLQRYATALGLTLKTSLIARNSH